MVKDYNEIRGTMLVPRGGHLSSAHDGLNYGGVLSDETNQVIAQARFMPIEGEGKKIVVAFIVGVGIGAIGASVYKKFRKSRQAKRLEEDCSSEHDIQQRDAVVAEATPVPTIFEVELTDEQKQEMALLFLDLADAQYRLKNLEAQGLDASAVKAHIARMTSTLADCNPKELADQVNRVIERQHRETQNLNMLLGRQPAANTARRPVTMQESNLCSLSNATSDPVGSAPCSGDLGRSRSEDEQVV